MSCWGGGWCEGSHIRLVVVVKVVVKDGRGYNSRQRARAGMRVDGQRTPKQASVTTRGERKGRQGQETRWHQGYAACMWVKGTLTFLPHPAAPGLALEQSQRRKGLNPCAAIDMHASVGAFTLVWRRTLKGAAS